MEGKPGENQEKTIADQLQVYAGHAIELLDIISFAVKQLDIQGAEMPPTESRADKRVSIVSNDKDWKPTVNVNSLAPTGPPSGRRLSVMSPNHPAEQAGRGDSFFPVISEVRVL